MAQRRLLGRTTMFAYRRVWRRLRPAENFVPSGDPSRALPPAVDAPAVLEPAGA